MCVLPKAPKVPVAPERQAMQAPQDAQGRVSGLNARRRRGLWASVLTGPKGLTSTPTITGTGSGVLGG